MRRGISSLLAVAAVLAAALACFRGLVARPDGLLVDGVRPSVDHARRVESAGVVGNDLTRLFLPLHMRMGSRTIRDGHLPLWDPSGFGGRPAVGNPQAGLFYPPAWLAWLSGRPSALGWLTIAHLIWAAIGSYRLLRTLQAGKTAASVASGCVLCSPYVIAQTFEGHYPHVWAYSWYPWAFWAGLQLRAGGWVRGFCLAPILAMAFLTGHPQEWTYLIIALSVWALVEAIQEIRGGRPRRAVLRLSAIGAMVGLSIGLAAIELSPDVASQAWALREGRPSMKHAGRYHIDPLNLLQLLTPRALGGPADYDGHENFWESVLSVGLIPLALAGVAAIAGGTTPYRGATRGWTALAIGSVAFAAGRKLGVFAACYLIVPGMDRFRVPARALFLASLAGGVLAGLGVEVLASPGAAGGRRAPRRRFVAWVAAVAALLAALALVVSRPESMEDGPAASKSPAHRRGRDEPYAIRELGRWARGASRIAADPACLAAASTTILGLAWLRRRPGDRRVIAGVLGVLGIAELAYYGQALLAVTPAREFLGADPIGEAMLRARPASAGPSRIRARDEMYDDLHAFHRGWDKTNAYDSFQIRHAADLYTVLYPMFHDGPLYDPDDVNGEAVDRWRHATRRSVLDRMAATFVISGRAEHAEDWPVVASGTCVVGPFVIQGNPTATPRAYVVPEAVPCPADLPGVLAAFRSVDPRRAVLMSSDPLGPATGPRQPFTPAEWASTDPDRLVLRVETAAPGLLVIADTWMPGWAASVDGVPAEVLRGNHAQRVIALPNPGRHEVTLRYEPPGLAAGAAVTGASSAAWLALMLAAARVRTRRGRAAIVRPSHSASAATIPGSGPRGRPGRTTSCPRSGAR